MAKNLVIVESPAKAKTLKKFLGSTYKIEASVGHVRDLPKSELGINIADDFEPKYITIRGKGDLLAKLRKEAKDSDKVYLATDPDREGEAISWHLMHALKLNDKKAFRITFNEITKNAVKRSIKEARDIDMDLVDAQQARRALDRIVGYKISPLLWKKVKKGLSAGRVQSVSLKIICEREKEVESFVPEEYWSVEALFQTTGKAAFKAKLTAMEAGKLPLPDKDSTDSVAKALQKAKFTTTEVKHGTRNKKPVQPFTTSTLQQEASKHLGFATHKTMMLAQQLYEGIDIKGEGTVGLVSYIRTDSMRISDEAYEELRPFIVETYGEQYANEAKTQHKAKGRSQDAHECIRPTSTLRTPQALKDSLSRDQLRLYKLIWERFVASQMTPAVYDTVSVKINADSGHTFRASGSRMVFPGFLAVYNAKEEEGEGEEDVKMPALEEGEALNLKDLDLKQHFTQPPPRYTEAMLVKTMEELGIGRPSTYASTISNIVARGYVTKENKVFYPTELGEIINDIMGKNFDEIVDIEFTAKMEADLDRVEDGELSWKEVLRQFYPAFDEKLQLAEEKIGQIEVRDEVTDILCENCGRNMVIKYGRYGKFLACPGFPECRNAKPFFEDAGVTCPLCGGKVQIKKTKKGRKYYGCDHNPECTFMSWSKPTGEKCPKCGDVLVEKGAKTKKIVCNRVGCGYSTEAKEDSDE